MYLLGYDIGSSSVKAALVETATARTVGISQYPEQEMPVNAPYSDWAEQDPSNWWTAVCLATRKLLAATNIPVQEIAGIGIAYQMHGLVMLSKTGAVLRPSIIWCDSRAVNIGERAFKGLGESFCLENYLNSPGNFTASKLRWVRENEQEIFARTDKIMLPGDYIAYRMTGDIASTITGFSEGVMWDFKRNAPAYDLLDFFEIPRRMLPDITAVFSPQGKLRPDAAREMGLQAGIPITYRAGDQPNNAMSLNVLRPGELAASGGTSGVVYAVTEAPVADPLLRVNSFAHVNYSPQNPLTGVLLCINGAGSAYRWARQAFGAGKQPYTELEKLAASVEVGSEGLTVHPFGNGAERMLGNRNSGAVFSGLQFNRHEARHFYRAVLEGIAFSFVQGIEIMRGMGIPIEMLRAGNDNLFQSTVFSRTVATLSAAKIEVISTTGAAGAAKAAGVATGIYATPEEAVGSGAVLQEYSPDISGEAYRAAYDRWQNLLKK